MALTRAKPSAQAYSLSLTGTVNHPRRRCFDNRHDYHAVTRGNAYHEKAIALNRYRGREVP